MHITMLIANEQFLIIEGVRNYFKNVVIINETVHRQLNYFEGEE